MRMRLSGGEQVAAESAQADAAIKKTSATAQAAGAKASTGIRRSLNSQIQSMRSIGRGLTRYVTAPILGVAAISGKFAYDFDRNMRNVNSIAQLPERQFRSLKQSVLDLAGPTAQTPNTLAEGLYDLVSSGFDANESIRILRKSALAASAGLTTTETATKAVAAALNSYELPASRAGQVSDQLFETVNRGVLTFDELASTIGDVLPFASQLGVGLDQLGAAVSTMTKAGLSAPETMTRIKNTLVTLLKPGKDLSKTLKEMGMSGEELVRRKGLQGALEAILATTDGTKESVAKLFPNIRALGGVLSLTGNRAGSAREDLEAFSSTAGATARVLAEQEKSFGFQLQRSWADLQAVLIEIGEQVLPIVVPPFLTLMGLVRDTVQGFAALPEPVKAAAGELAILAALAGPMLLFASAILTAAKNLGILQATQGGMALNKGRIGRLGAGLAGVGAMTAGQAVGGTGGAALGNIGGLGLLGFGVGGPVGAAAGAGLGAAITFAPAILDLLSNGPKLSRLQREIQSQANHSAEAMEGYRRSLEHLSGSKGRARRAEQAHSRAVREANEAGRYQAHILARFALNSQPALRAALRMANANRQVAKTARQAARADELHGFALKLFRRESLHLVASEKQRIPSLRRQLRAVKERMKAEGETTPLLKRAVGLGEKLKAVNLSLAKSYAEAEAKGGKGWASRLKSLNSLQAKYGAGGKVLVDRQREIRNEMRDLTHMGKDQGPMWEKLREELKKTTRAYDRLAQSIAGVNQGGTLGLAPEIKPPKRRGRNRQTANEGKGSEGLQRLMANAGRPRTVYRQPVQMVMAPGGKRVLAEGVVDVQDDDDARL